MKRLSLPAIVLLGVLTMAGCSAPSGSAGEADSGGDVGAPSAPVDSGEGRVPAFDKAEENREVIVTGSVLITAVDPIAASEASVRIVEAAGGRVDARTEYAPTEGNNGSARLTLRIPASDLSQTLGELKELGTVEKVQISSENVTHVARDLDARIAALSASLDRLLQLMATAENTEVLLQLEREVTERQGTLDSLRSQRRLLTDQVAMSTITLELTSVASAPVGTPSTVVDALAAGLASFIAFFTGVLYVVSYLLPWLVLLGIIALVIVLSIRRKRRAAVPATET